MQKAGHRLRQRAEIDEPFERVRRPAELADGDARALESERPNDRVDARTILEPGVHDRLRLVDPSAERRDDALDDGSDALVVGEAGRRASEVPVLFDVDGLLVDHHDLRDRGIGQKVLERTEAERFVGHFAYQRLPIDVRRQAGLHALHDLLQRDENARAEGRILQFGGVDLREVEMFEELTVNFAAQTRIVCRRRCREGGILRGLRTPAVSKRDAKGGSALRRNASVAVSNRRRMEAELETAHEHHGVDGDLHLRPPNELRSHKRAVRADQGMTPRYRGSVYQDVGRRFSADRKRSRATE